jgi:hypothetical protein
MENYSIIIDELLIPEGSVLNKTTIGVKTHVQKNLRVIVLP